MKNYKQKVKEHFGKSDSEVNSFKLTYPYISKDLSDEEIQAICDKLKGSKAEYASYIDSLEIAKNPKTKAKIDIKEDAADSTKKSIEAIQKSLAETNKKLNDALKAKEVDPYRIKNLKLRIQTLKDNLKNTKAKLALQMAEK